jgi:hypothetical protein
VTLIDLKSPLSGPTIAVHSELESAAAGDGRLFVVLASRGAIAVIDVPKSALIKSMQIKGVPSGLADDKDADLLMSVCGNGVTKFLHSDGKAVASPKTGAGSDGLIFAAQRKLAFAPAVGTACSPSSRSWAAPRNCARRSQPRKAPVWSPGPKTGYVYLPAGKLGPPVPPNPLPTVVPGSFEILAVGRK